MGNGAGQLDVAHALTAHDAAGYFYAALVADNTLVTDALVLAAVALPIFGRSKDALVEQAILFGFLGTVVNGLWLSDVAV